MKKIILTTLSLCAVFSTVCYAGSSTGPVTQLITNGASQVLFKAGTNSAPPGCAALNPDSWAIDTSTSAGKSMYATLLTAKALEVNVTVQGLNNCGAHPDRENVQFLIMSDS